MQNNFIESLTVQARYQPEDWETKYNFKAYDLIVNKQTSQNQIIMKGTRQVAIVSKFYQSVPNELVQEIADGLAEEKGWKPIHLGYKKWANNEIKSHVTQDKYGDSMCALYIAEEDVEVTRLKDGQRDTVKLGMGIGNSIDGSRGLWASIFTFRDLCQNIMHHESSSRMMRVSEFEKLRIGEEGFNERAITASITRKHTKSLVDLEPMNISLSIRKVLKDMVEKTIKGTNNVIARYQEMVTEKLSELEAKRMVLAFPKQVLEKLPYISVTEEGTKMKVKLTDTEVSKWRCFNDVTQVLTHSDRMSFNGNINNMKKLDAILVRRI